MKVSQAALLLTFGSAMFCASRSAHAQAYNCYAPSGSYCEYQYNGETEYPQGTSYYGITTGGVGVYGQDTTDGVGVQAQTATGNAVAATATSTGTAVAASSTSGIGVNSGGGTIGVEGSAPKGVVGLSGTPTVPSVTAGVIGSGSGSSAYGVYGVSADSDGGHFLTSADGTSGLFAENSSSGSSAYTVGVRGISYGTAGAGVYANNYSTGYGVYANSTSGAGVYAGGDTYGVYATASGADAYGLYASGTGTNATGVYGTSSGGTGVAGVSTDGGYGVTASSTDNYAIQAISSASTGIYGSGSVDGVYGTSSTSTGSGIVGANTSTGYAGYFYGKVTVTGEITVGSCSGCTSDIRLKKDVKPLKGAIDQLLALKGVTFEWKNPEEHEGHSGTQTGFIAQDVQKLFPEWVKDGGYTAPDGQKYKTLDTRQIEALEVESIRTLRSDNEKQQAQISELQEQVRALASGHPIPASGFNFGGTNVGLLGPAAAIAYAASRRKPNEKRA